MPNETNEILQRLTRLETKLDLMGTAKDVANEALQSAKSAHLRLDKIDKITNWLTTTIIGAIILAVIGFALKGGFLK